MKILIVDDCQKNREKLICKIKSGELKIVIM